MKVALPTSKQRFELKVDLFQLNPTKLIQDQRCSEVVKESNPWTIISMIQMIEYFTIPMDEFTWTPRILDHHNCVAYEVQKCCEYTIYYTQCHRFQLSCSILNVNYQWSVTNTNHKPNIIPQSLHYRFIMMHLPSLMK